MTWDDDAQGTPDMGDPFAFYPELSDAKLVHMRAVAEKMRNAAMERGWGREHADDMYLLGLLHDIGYVVERSEHGFHGSNLLERNGYRYAHEVRHHGKPVDDPSPALLLLWWADLTTDHMGSDVSVETRLDDIAGRYGTSSRQYANASAIAAKLAEME